MIGQFLGYPACCVQAFIDMQQVAGTAFEGTGFRPCRRCADKPVYLVLMEIATNRIYEKPFPLHDTDEILRHVEYQRLLTAAQ